MLQGIETVQIVRKTRSGTNEYGLPSDITETLITVNNVLVGFDSSEEPVIVNEDPVNTSVSLYMPTGTVIQTDDEFIIRGERFVKDSRPMDWQSPFAGFDAGVVVKVRQRIG